MEGEFNLVYARTWEDLTKNDHFLGRNAVKNPETSIIRPYITANSSLWRPVLCDISPSALFFVSRMHVGMHLCEEEWRRLVLAGQIVTPRPIKELFPKKTPTQHGPQIETRARHWDFGWDHCNVGSYSFQHIHKRMMLCGGKTPTARRPKSGVLADTSTHPLCSPHCQSHNHWPRPNVLAHLIQEPASTGPHSAYVRGCSVS